MPAFPSFREIPSAPPATAASPTPLAKSASSLLMKVKEEGEKTDLKLNIQKTEIIASGPITLWQIGGETMETVTEFIFLGSKITEDFDCSHEIKRRLPLEIKLWKNYTAY